MKFKDKTVFITGGANGIGKGIAKSFAEEGAKVVIADIAEKEGAELQEKLVSEGREAFFVYTDVRDEGSVITAMEKTAAQFGTIDILINNAGISKFISFTEMTLEEWDEILQTNLRSVFLCSREAVKLMKSGGSIVNMASTRASMSEPDTEAYSASKGGITSMTHALARTLAGKGIRVNSISPGWIETKHYDELREKDHKQHLSGRVGKPSDIARCCLYLCDPENDFVTGENIVVDGGMTRKMMYEE
ncbi:SDR family NAD(P)-dependent oxidoreductase [Bacillus infantis]|uniref:SDR family oxidoreductase n=1 Tax=Bacillus infantis TaxID=324767 RepID=A0A5D4RG98_9BACI|nr:SDR family oxidoreductase [Bacillus infantis]TYS49880.1 SDR family oxidoreductase [Bacillus infantis]